jgi:hypothetical protein
MTDSKITINQINEEIKKCHNPNLVIETSDPNGNIIYHLYKDGTITHQKGGRAYMQRSEFDDYFPINKSYDELVFPITKNKFEENHYAIMTKEDAVRIRNMMLIY